MNDLTNTPVCERTDQLMSFLYGESDEREAQEFQLHLRECIACRSEMASFGELRESITDWKEETVGRFAVPQLASVVVRNKSALTALREFLDLSPLWLKGAVGFATLLFALLLGLAVFRPQPTPTPVIADSKGQYTKEQVDQIVKKALDDQASALAQKQDNNQKNEVMAQAPVAPISRQSRVRTAKTRPSLSRAEREQLAADLRLLKDDDETNLNLLGDRINQEF